MLEIKEFTQFKDGKMLEDYLPLHEAIFQVSDKARLLSFNKYQNLLILIAYVDEKPAGFKVGWASETDNHTFYSWAGGVLPEYRKQGIASELMTLQHARAKQLGMKFVETKSYEERWADMISLNRKLGFEEIERYPSKKSGVEKILFRKVL